MDDALLQRGSNSAGVRRYNERLVLATIQRHQGASKAEIARHTGLSPQAAVRIVDSLEESGRLVRSGRRTGGMGQPAIIYKVNGASGCTIGVEIGRDRVTCVMVDFEGMILSQWSRAVNFPQPSQVIDDLVAFTARELATRSAEQRDGFLGVGVAMPWFIGAWRDELGITDAQAADWKNASLADRFRSSLDCPLFFENDGNAGALAELLGGAGLNLRDFLYVHIGTFIGGGLVLNSQLHEGRNGNAGALASIPVPGPRGCDVLLHRASGYMIEERLAGEPTDPAITDWLEDCSTALSFTIIGCNSLLDLEAVIIGGILPHPVLQRLIDRIASRITTDAPKDFFAPALLAGHNGPIAPARGAALLPLFSTFSPNLAALLKGNPAES